MLLKLLRTQATPVRPLLRRRELPQKPQHVPFQQNRRSFHQSDCCNADEVATFGSYTESASDCEQQHHCLQDRQNGGRQCGRSTSRPAQRMAKSRVGSLYRFVILWVFRRNRRERDGRFEALRTSSVV